MSHTVSFKTRVKNVESIHITAKRMGLSEPKYVEGYRMSEKRVTGIAVRLPGWRKHVVFDTESGSVEFDNWSPFDENHPMVRQGKKQVGDDGRWGDIVQLHQFIDEYLGTEVMLQAATEGHVVEDCHWDAAEGAFKVKIRT